MAYQTTDDDGNVVTCGDPSPEEEYHGEAQQEEEGEWEPENDEHYSAKSVWEV